MKQVKVISASGHKTEVELKPIPIGTALESAGLGRATVLQKLARQMDAEDTVLAQWNGEFTDIAQVPANPSRNKAIELACKLHGLIDAKPDLNVGVAITINWDSGMPAWTQPVQNKAIDIAAADTPTPTVTSQIEGTGMDPRRTASHPLGQETKAETLSERVAMPKKRSRR